MHNKVARELQNKIDHASRKQKKIIICADKFDKIYIFEKQLLTSYNGDH
jgi:hypothetical protein